MCSVSASCNVSGCGRQLDTAAGAGCLLIRLVDGMVQEDFLARSLCAAHNHRERGPDALEGLAAPQLPQHLPGFLQGLQQAQEARAWASVRWTCRLRELKGRLGLLLLFGPLVSLAGFIFLLPMLHFELGLWHAAAVFTIAGPVLTRAGLLVPLLRFLAHFFALLNSFFLRSLRAWALCWEACVVMRRQTLPFSFPPLSSARPLLLRPWPFRRPSVCAFFSQPPSPDQIKACLGVFPSLDATGLLLLCILLLPLELEEVYFAAHCHAEAFQSFHGQSKFFRLQVQCVTGQLNSSRRKHPASSRRAVLTLNFGSFCASLPCPSFLSSSSLKSSRPAKRPCHSFFFTFWISSSM